MTEREISKLFVKLEEVSLAVAKIETSVAVLAERSSRHVDETTVSKIVKEALVEHGKTCAAAVETMQSKAGTTIHVGGVNGKLITTLIAAAAAVASYYLGGAL